jgi:hypothetical protein
MNQEDFITIEHREYEALLVRLNRLESKNQRTSWKWLLKRSAMVLVALVMLSVLGVGAQDTVGLYSGNTYLAQTGKFRDGYIAGVADTCHSNIDHSTLLKFKECTGKMTLGQIRAIAEKYLQDNPQNRHVQMAVLSIMAVVGACSK